MKWKRRNIKASKMVIANRVNKKMEVIVFGASGFIGSHVCEQLILAGYAVTGVVRSSSNTVFLQSIGVMIKAIDFSSDVALNEVIDGHELVYNCLASVKLHQSLNVRRMVDVELTERVIQAAAVAKAKRFVQLSTVQVYGFSRPPEPIDEDHPCEAIYAFNRVAQEREAIVKKVADKTGIELVIARPVNTIGARDSTMGKVFGLHKKGHMVVFGNGENKFSCVDTRDLGRAMVLLGESPQAAGNTYLIRGFDTSWKEIKTALDNTRKSHSKLICIPSKFAKKVAGLLEKIIPYRFDLQLTPFSVSVMSEQTLFDDKKIRALGCVPRYGLIETIKAV